MTNNTNEKFDIYQKWICLSNKSFENRKYEKYNVDSIPYFKPVGGMWFSLPTNNKYISEWGEFLKNSDDFSGFIDEEGNTNVITAKLKNDTYLVKLEEWKDTIIDVLKTTPQEITCDEKREILLNKIREKTSDSKIKYTIFDIKEEEFFQIEEMYYEQSGDMIKKEKEAKGFESAEDIFISKFGFNNFFEKFPEVKENVFLNIELFKSINEKQFSLKYSDIESYLDNNIKEEIENFKIEKDFNEITVTEDDIVEYITEYVKKHYGFLDFDYIKEYGQFISEIDNVYEYRNKRKEKTELRLKKNKEIDWLVEYFNGTINQKNITGYDMPSLAIFDTNCLDVLLERKEKIFEERENDFEEQLI